MLATLNIATNPFNPTLDRIQKPIIRRVKINTLVKREKIDLNKPVICMKNGEAVLRKDWGTTVIKDGDVVSFVYLPEGGGGGSSPLRMVLMIAVMTFAPYMAGTVMGLTGTALTVGTAAITVAGTMLVNALVPPPKPPSSQIANGLAAPSPTYNIGAQGNTARIGQAIPVLYGRMKVYPDFAAQPYGEFENNEQYLYQLFVISQGRVMVKAENIFVEDTHISGFGTDYELELLYPGEKSTLFPTGVFNATEVAGQSITFAKLGPYTINPSTTLINKIAVDIVAGRGLYRLNEEGKMRSASATFNIKAIPVDDEGQTSGAAIDLGNHTMSGATSTAVRRTFKFDVPEGRYGVEITRVDSVSTDQRVAHDIAWAGARGYSSQEIDYGNVTMLAMKIRTNNTISQQSSRKINVIGERVLERPTWDEATQSYSWAEDTESVGSIALAAMDACRAPYGAQADDTRYNIAQLLYLEQIWEGRTNSLGQPSPDRFNAVFDSTQAFWDALTSIVRAGRARPFVQGGIIHFTRDALQSLPTTMFTSRNIVKGSFRLNYVMPSEDSSDHVIVEYFDERSWRPRTVKCVLDAGTVKKPAKVKAFGITSREQAHREGMMMAAVNRYRRKEISFETELEGHIPSLGDMIAIQSDIPEWGQHAEVVDFQGGVATLSEPLTWTDNVAHYVMLRHTNGSAEGPIQVERGADPYKIVFSYGVPQKNMYWGYEKEKTYVAFGRSGQVVQLAKVLSITPRQNTVAITAINEDVRVHSADGTPTPIDEFYWAIPTPQIRPVLQDFTVVQTGSGTTPSISISWSAVPGAGRYIIERSTDGENWETLGEVTTTSFSFIANTGELHIRVAAFGGVIGPWVYKQINVGEVPPPLDVTGGQVIAVGQSYEVSWNPVPEATGYYVEVLAGLTPVVRRSFNTQATKFSYTIENMIADGGPWRTVQFRVKATNGLTLSSNWHSVTGTNAAPAAPTLTVVAGLKNVSLTASPSNELDYAGTIFAASKDPGFTPAPDNYIHSGNSNFFLHQGISEQWYYRAAHFDTYGRDGLNWSNEYSSTPSSNVGEIYVGATLPTTGNYDGRIAYLTTDELLYTWSESTGQWTVVGASGGLGPGTVTEDHLAARAVTAQKIAVGKLSAISADMGDLNAGTITLDNGGHIKGGQTSYNTGVGYYLGYTGGTYKFSIGNSSQGLTWDGSELSIKGRLQGATGTFAGQLEAATGVFKGELQVSSAQFGARLVIAGDRIRVIDNNEVVRVIIGRLN
ncbi:host specificity factor TipJ family phage tail protein [Methylobacillus sp.]|uniref:host specificity factor TipJ family phage tail protein n=1 Tax=Methylobacillus sp. TaxID=56818 RepID=UPI002579C6A2|nr:host specificity factor TipJ family phage tail protein [Methylobacillus sp.]